MVRSPTEGSDSTIRNFFTRGELCGEPGREPRDRNDRPGGGNAAGDVAPRRAERDWRLFVLARKNERTPRIRRVELLVETISPEPVERMTGTVLAPGKSMIPAPQPRERDMRISGAPTGCGERARLAQIRSANLDKQGKSRRIPRPDDGTAKGGQTPREGRHPRRPSGSLVGPVRARSIDFGEYGARIRPHVQASAPVAQVRSRLWFQGKKAAQAAFV